MTISETPKTGPLALSISALASLFARPAGRRQRSELAGLTPARLKDIGLAPEEDASLSAAPLSRFPDFREAKRQWEARLWRAAGW